MRVTIGNEYFRPIVLTLEDIYEVEIIRTLLGLHEDSIRKATMLSIRSSTLHEMRQVFEDFYWEAHFYEKE